MTAAFLTGRAKGNLSVATCDSVAVVLSGWFGGDRLLVALRLASDRATNQLTNADPSVGGGCLHEFALGASHTERKVIRPRGRTLRFVEHARKPSACNAFYVILSGCHAKRHKWSTERGNRDRGLPCRHGCGSSVPSEHDRGWSSSLRNRGQ